MSMNKLINVDNPAIQGNFSNGGNLWQKKTLIESTIVQSMAFDYRADPEKPEIFIMQCKSGSPDGGKETGEQVLNRLDYKGNNLGTTGLQLLHKHGTQFVEYESEWDNRLMTAYEKDGIGFGHGTQIGIEFAPDGRYIWTDCDSPVINREITHKDGRWDVVGTKLCRVKYYNNTTYRPNSPEVQKLSNTKLGLPSGLFKTPSHIGYCTVSIDNVNKLFAIKYVDYTDNAQMKLSVYKYSYPSSYDGTPNSMTFIHQKTFNINPIKWWLARIDGSCSHRKGDLVPNGWAIFGDYVYLGYGTAYWNRKENVENGQSGQWKFYSPKTTNGYVYDSGFYADNQTPITKVGNTRIRCYNWKTGQLVNESFTEAGKSNNHRELEGLAIIPTVVNGNVTKLKLFLSFAGGVPGDRDWSFFYKEQTF